MAGLARTLFCDEKWVIRERHCTCVIAPKSGPTETKFWEMTVEIYLNVFEERKKDKTTVFVEYGVAKHRLRALMAETVPKARG